MLPNKIELTDKIVQMLSNKRKETGVSAYDLSESLQKSKYWLSNIEAGKTKFISKEDLLDVIKRIVLIGNDDVEQYTENLINSVDILPVSTTQLELFKVYEDETNDDDLRKEFDKHLNGIVEMMTVLYEHVEPKNRQDVIDMTKRMRTNLNSDLGYMISIFSMRWCKLSSLSVDIKRKLIKDIFELINQNGSDCKECKSKRDNDKKADC